MAGTKAVDPGQEAEAQAEVAPELSLTPESTILGTTAIVEITTQMVLADIPRDFCTNTLHFNTGSSSVSAANWQALTDALKGVWFATTGSHQHYGSNGGKIVAYDVADAHPRPEKAVTTYTPGTWEGARNNPPQVTICSSFYSGRNLPRLRGRIYVPLNNAYSVAFRPTAPQMSQTIALANNLNVAAIALTPSWALGIYSKAANSFNPATNFWCNDVWDTQRRRAPKETTRLRLP